MGKSPKKKSVQAAVGRSKEQQDKYGGRGTTTVDTVSPVTPKTITDPGSGQHGGGKKDHPKV